jgi:hypothetical protein
VAVAARAYNRVRRRRGRGRRTGDGDEPVLRVKASRLRTKGRGLAAAVLPVELAIFVDRVEEKRPGLAGRHKTQAIRFDQVAQVSLRRGLPFCTLTIESTGGHSIVAEGLSRGDADRAKAEIEARIGGARISPISATANTADELAQLADLHKQGALNDEEFAAAKKSLLGL